MNLNHWFQELEFKFIMLDIHPDFQQLLAFKSKNIINIYTDLRSYLLEINPDCNELLYHTHALTSVYTLSSKLSDGYCMIPIYTSHLNLGFHRGTLLNDPYQLLQGTGKWIRHIPINVISDYRNAKVNELIKQAINLAKQDMNNASTKTGQIFSKIKLSK